MGEEEKKKMEEEQRKKMEEEKILEKHNKELKQLESAVENERERQRRQLQERLEAKKAARKAKQGLHRKGSMKDWVQEIDQKTAEKLKSVVAKWQQTPLTRARNVANAWLKKTRKSKELQISAVSVKKAESPRERPMSARGQDQPSARADGRPVTAAGQGISTALNPAQVMEVMNNTEMGKRLIAMEELMTKLVPLMQQVAAEKDKVSTTSGSRQRLKSPTPSSKPSKRK